MIGGRWAILVLGVVGLIPRPARAEPESTRFGVGAGLGASFYLFEDVGPWLDLSGVARIPLGQSWYLSPSITLAYTSNQHSKSLDFNGDGSDDANTDELQVFGLWPRALIGLRLGSAWSLEAGGFAGLAHTTLASTQCGSSSATDLAMGASLGPALRLGERQQWSVALHAAASWLPTEKCSNGGGPDPFVFAPFVHRQDDAQVGSVVHAQYLF